MEPGEGHFETAHGVPLLPPPFLSLNVATKSIFISFLFETAIFRQMIVLLLGSGADANGPKPLWRPSRIKQRISATLRELGQTMVGKPMEEGCYGVNCCNFFSCVKTFLPLYYLVIKLIPFSVFCGEMFSYIFCLARL